MTNAIKKAGTRFPFINLQKSVERAKLLFEADQRGREMGIPAAFSVWGYSEKSSGGFQTIAALKGYGLLKEGNGADARKVGLSDEALRYFRDERPEEKSKLLKVFALRPKLIAALWNDWGATPPADTIARSQLKTEAGLNDQSARSLLSIYKENLSYSELKGHHKAVEIPSEKDDNDKDGDAQEIEVGDLIQVEIGGAFQLPHPAKVRAIQEHDGQEWVFVDGEVSGIPMSQTSVIEKGAGSATRPPQLALEDASPAPGIWKEVTDLDEGDVVLTLPESLSPESYEDLKAWLALILRKAQRRAGVKDDKKSGLDGGEPEKEVVS